MACWLRRTGVLWSSASPVIEMKIVGMHSVLPLGFSRTYAGLITSQPVYPRASKVLRSPPLGNELASCSPWTSVLPENDASAVPSPTGSRKLSCFSAVRPVSG